MRHWKQNTLRGWFWVIWLAITSPVFGQDNFIKEFVPPTPNAAALGEFGDIPVSHHTGVPNISVPIFTVTEGELSLPISLDYHSSGVKVDEISSWVGLGWSLNAGGVITRTVQGKADEQCETCSLQDGGPTQPSHQECVGGQVDNQIR